MSLWSLVSTVLFNCRLLQRGNRYIQCSSVHFLDGDSGQDVSDFSWDDYLEENGAVSVPHHAFKHVSQHVFHIPNVFLTSLV